MFTSLFESNQLFLFTLVKPSFNIFCKCNSHAICKLHVKLQQKQPPPLQPTESNWVYFQLIAIFRLIQIRKYAACLNFMIYLNKIKIKIVSGSGLIETITKKLITMFSLSIHFQEHHNCHSLSCRFRRVSQYTLARFLQP